MDDRNGRADVRIETDRSARAPIPAADAWLPDFGAAGEPGALPQEDAEAEEHVAFEGRDFGLPDGPQPETQGEEPLDAALGENGQGDLEPELGPRSEALPEPDAIGRPGRSGRERSDPADPDGLFERQDMPTVDGEMSEGGAESGTAGRA